MSSLEQKRQICVVEDNLDQTEIMSLSLETERYNVVFTQTIEEATEIFTRLPPNNFDAVLLDDNLNGSKSSDALLGLILRLHPKTQVIGTGSAGPVEGLHGYILNKWEANRVSEFFT